MALCQCGNSHKYFHSQQLKILRRYESLCLFQQCYSITLCQTPDYSPELKFPLCVFSSFASLFCFHSKCSISQALGLVTDKSAAANKCLMSYSSLHPIHTHKKLKNNYRMYFSIQVRHNYLQHK